MTLRYAHLSSGHQTDAVFIIHHTGRDTARGYRSPVEWWASADVMIGLEPTGGGRVRVKPEKNRDGRRLEPFLVRHQWTEESFAIRYEGRARAKGLSASARKCDIALRERGRASQAEIQKATGLNRNTIPAAAAACVEAGLWRPTGEAANNSPVYEHTGKPLPGEGE